MNMKRSNNSSRIKNFGLAACAIMALGVMTAGEAAAQQCRLGGGNAGYGFNTGYGNYGNSYNRGSNFNNRFNAGYNNGYGATGYRGYSNQRPSLSLGLSYNSNRNLGDNSGYGNYGTGGYNTGAFANRSRFGNGNGFYSNNQQQPVAYRHGDHIDVEDGNQRIHLRGRGF